MKFCFIKTGFNVESLLETSGNTNSNSSRKASPTMTTTPTNLASMFTQPMTSPQTSMLMNLYAQHYNTPPRPAHIPANPTLTSPNAFSSWLQLQQLFTLLQQQHQGQTPSSPLFGSQAAQFTFPTNRHGF
jgi:hypothetical protein